MKSTATFNERWGFIVTLGWVACGWHYFGPWGALLTYCALYTLSTYIAELRR